MSATDKELGELHALLAKLLREQLQSEPDNVQLMNAARQFLKDNNIQPSRDNEEMFSLGELVDNYEADPDGPLYDA